MFKEFRIFANNCKKNFFVWKSLFRKSINYTCRYWLGFWKEQIHRDDFYFFRKKIFSAETDAMFYITCSTSSFCVFVTSNYAVAFNINFCVKNFPSSFVWLIPITVALDFFAINLISSIFGKRILTFICKKCNPFSSNTFLLRPSIWELWGGPGFRLMSLERRSIKVKYLAWFLQLLW